MNKDQLQAELNIALQANKELADRVEEHHRLNYKLQARVKKLEALLEEEIKNKPLITIFHGGQTNEKKDTRN